MVPLGEVTRHSRTWPFVLYMCLVTLSAMCKVCLSFIPTFLLLSQYLSLAVELLRGGSVALLFILLFSTYNNPVMQRLMEVAKTFNPKPSMQLASQFNRNRLCQQLGKFPQENLIL